MLCFGELLMNLVNIMISVDCMKLHALYDELFSFVGRCIVGWVVYDTYLKPYSDTFGDLLG